MTAQGSDAEKLPPQEPPAGWSLDQWGEVLQALKKSKADREALNALLGPLFQDVWTAALQMIEELLPHEKGSNSVNEQRFSAYRFRMLNAGNTAKRQAERFLRDFVVTQVFRSETVQRVVAKPQGMYKLPPGVRMPCEKPRAQEQGQGQGKGDQTHG
jgi:hypothetical protein